MEEQPIREKAVQKPNAWVVDDTLSARAIASRKLTAKGYFVYHAIHGVEAQQKLHQLPPVKLFVIDCQMGGKNQEGEDLDGPALIAWIRQQDCYQKVRIIGCSAVPDQMRQETILLLRNLGLESNNLVFIAKKTDINHYIFDRSAEFKKNLCRTRSSSDPSFFKPAQRDDHGVKRVFSSSHLNSPTELPQTIPCPGSSPGSIP